MVEVGDRGVERQISFKEEPVSLALFGNQRKAVLHGITRTFKVHQVVSEEDTPRSARAHAKDSLQQLRAPSAHQPIQAKYLSFAHVKRNVLKMGRIFRG